MINDCYSWSGESELGDIDDENSCVMRDFYSWSGESELGDIDDERRWM